MYIYNNYKSPRYEATIKTLKSSILYIQPAKGGQQLILSAKHFGSRSELAFHETHINFKSGSWNESATQNFQTNNFYSYQCWIQWALSMAIRHSHYK